MAASVDTALLLQAIKEKVLKEGDDQGEIDEEIYDSEFDVAKQRLKRKKPDDSSYEHDIRLAHTLCRFFLGSKAKDTPKIPDAQGPAPVAPPPPPPPPQFPGQMLAGMPLDAFLAIQAVDAELARHIFDTYEKKAERLAAEKLALEKSAADQLTAEESPAKHLATSVVKVEETLTDSG
ncbi:hypothetical protein EYC84_007925 [Monilinia fructicola]|uniref:Uncharacterized protein n=1 Tax=Monilinia fructicola TaxID=38448 RepID=A0A5M9JLS3_MONFR|nr:hypothetical protein EYC84_007925 [Monilinia fructicola]